MAVDGSVAIALEGVSKGFGETRAVQDVTLAIGEGEFFSLLGPSGCGKTTTLRMIAGFEVPDEGRVVLQGTDVTSVSADRRARGLRGPAAAAALGWAAAARRACPCAREPAGGAAPGRAARSTRREAAE